MNQKEYTDKVQLVFQIVDPLGLIGGAPLDEYDSEATRVASAILKMDEEVTLDYSTKLFIEEFGLAVVNQDRLDLLVSNLRLFKRLLMSNI